MDSVNLQAIHASVGKAGHLLRELGPLALAGRLLPRITRSHADVGSVTFFLYRPEESGRFRPLSGFTVQQLHVTDKDAILTGTQSHWERLLARFAAGDLCFGALNQSGEAVHTRWVTLTGARIPELQLDFVPAPDAAYFYDGYTRPDARRHGIDAIVRGVIFECMRALGRRQVYSYVRGDNPAGLRAAARCQTPVATLRYLRLFSSRVRVFGPKRLAAAALVAPDQPDGDEATRRAAAWRTWFEGWRDGPLEQRSIGFHSLPDEAFQAMSEHIRETLGLDPLRDDVLDVGCDSALVTRHVTRHCRRLTGVDFIPGLLIDARRARGTEGADASLFAAADGRALPFPSGRFTKAYCSGVIHTLPRYEDGMAMVLEMVRVLAPGGQALIAAVPDVAKRGAARREGWRLGDFRERAAIVAAVALPRWARRLGHRLLPGQRPPPLRYLEYDLRRIKALIEQRGLDCKITDYPIDFWSRDFRLTRSNLLITVPSSPW